MDREILVHTGGGVLTAWVLDALRVRAVDVYQEVVDSYVEALREGAVLPPVQVVPVEGRYLLVDGRHRAAAWMAFGEGVRARVGEACSMAQAAQIALLANASHGHRRQAGDVTRCIEVALEVWPEESNRAIAQRVGCSHTLVNRVVARQAAPPEAETVSTQEGVLGAEKVVSIWPGGTVPQDISFADRMTELWGDEPEARDEAPQEASWVEDVDGELARMGPGRVLLASEEAEVLVAREVRRHRGQDSLERWYTDPALARVCWEWLFGSGLVSKGDLQVLEPCVGGGAWVVGQRAASLSLEHEGRMTWVVCDVDPEAPGLRDRRVTPIVCDVLEHDFGLRRFDVIITNPPNSKAMDVIQACLAALAPKGVLACLMPASWMAAKRRRRWLQVFTPRVVALVPWRPSFDGPAAELQGTGEGSPTQDYALHVWVNGDPPGRSWTGTWIDDSSKGEVDDGEE